MLYSFVFSSITEYFPLDVKNMMIDDDDDDDDDDEGDDDDDDDDRMISSFFLQNSFKSLNFCHTSPK